MHKELRDHLAVHPVDHAAVAREEAVEIFLAKRPLHARGKEAPERSNQRGKHCKHQTVQIPCVSSSRQKKKEKKKKSIIFYTGAIVNPGPNTGRSSVGSS